MRHFLTAISVGFICAVSSLMATSADVPTPKVKVAVDAAVIDLDGYYSISGIDAKGNRYSGIAMVRKINSVYLFAWHTGRGCNGIGLRDGDSISVGFSQVAEETQVQGVYRYTISAGPTLTGIWATVPGSGKVNRETLKFLAPLPVPEADE